MTAEIRVGDEVQNGGVIGVVTMISDRPNGHKAFDVIESNGHTWALNDLVTKKTGRRFPEVNELLKKMQEVKD